MSFEGRVAIITGGASGIGRAVARRLAAEGAAVAVADANRQGATVLVRELAEADTRAIALQVDVANPDEAAHMV